MIPSNTTKQVETTLTGEDVAMSLDADALEHIMGVLTDLYSDRELAVIREYSTNAADSHRAAGVDRPIEVSLPGRLRPTFTVRDYGTGLDAEDIRNIYSKYGASSKRETNELSGTLGLGCKSALTLVDQFTVTGWKGGVKTLVSVTRSASGGGVMKVLSETPSDEPSGALITVPCPMGSGVEAKARTFFRHWEAGTVLIDGHAPEPFPGGLEVAPGIEVWVSPRYLGYGQERDRYDGPPKSRVVMGNVAYPFDHPDDQWSRFVIQARVPIGAVDFPPSREALRMTAKTTAALNEVMEAVDAGLLKAAQAQVDAQGTRLEALAAAEGQRATVGDSNRRKLTWRGEAIPAMFHYPDAKRVKYGTDPKPVQGSCQTAEDKFRPDAMLELAALRSSYGYKNAHSGYHALSPTQVARAQVWVTGFTNRSWTSAMREKLDAYLASEGITLESGKSIILVRKDERPGGEWTKGAKEVAWADVRAFKDPNATKASGNTYAGTYYADRVGRFDRRCDGTLLADDEKLGTLYYLEGTLEYWPSGWVDQAKGVWPGCTVAVIPQTRIEKFKRTYPKAKPVVKSLEAFAKTWWDGLDERTRTILSTDLITDELTPLDRMNPTDLDDPQVAEWIELARDRAKATPALVRKHSSLRSFLPNTAYGMPDVLGNKLGERYALLTSVGYWNRNEETKLMKHLTMYINAAYAATQKENA